MEDGVERRVGYAEASVSSKERGGEAKKTCGESRDACARGRVCAAQQTEDASRKRAVVDGHGERGSLAPLLHERERASVIDGIAVNGDGGVIAAIFAFDAYAAADPPDRRVIEEQCFNRDLEKIDEAVEAADVSEFVSDDRFDLRFRETRKSRGGEKNHRTEPADDRGRVERGAFAIVDEAVDAEAALEFKAFFEKFARDGTRVFAAHFFDDEEAASGPEAEEENTGEPEFDQGEERRGLRRRRSYNGRCGR